MLHFTEGGRVRGLASGASDLHCGGIDDERPLPSFLRREPLLQVTAGIVARRDHPIQAARPTPPTSCVTPGSTAIRRRARTRTGAGAGPVLRAGGAGLRLLVSGPWLSWAPLALLVRLPALGLKPLPLAFGRRRYRNGLVARRSTEDLAPVRRFEDIVRTIAREGIG